MKKIILLVILVIFRITNFAQSDTSLSQIKKNYNRINSLKKWSQIKEATNYKAYDEGQDNKVILFYSSDTLEKITVILYREMSKKETHYYFLNNKMSLVIDSFTMYKEPYQLKNARTLIDKLYFKDGKLIALINEQNSGWDMPSDKEVYELFQEEVDKIKKMNE